MALSEAEKHAMILATRETAWAMIDDIEHMREVLAKPEPTPGDIRRMSNVLRRLLIDNNGDLRKIAATRIGRVNLLVPDILPLFRSGERLPYHFLSAGVADVFGISIDTWIMDRHSQVRKVDDHEPGKTALVGIDGFLSQKVICFDGQWITRADTIKYIANIASGVHSGVVRTEKEELLRRTRYVATISLEGGNPTLSFNINVPPADEKPATVDRKALDFVLVQLMSSARYIAISDDIIRLEQIIKKEIS